eukprot:1148091-Pelagomonas_calceolata.AAC.4
MKTPGPGANLRPSRAAQQPSSTSTKGCSSVYPLYHSRPESLLRRRFDNSHDQDQPRNNAIYLPYPHWYFLMDSLAEGVLMRNEEQAHLLSGTTSSAQINILMSYRVALTMRIYELSRIAKFHIAVLGSDSILLKKCWQEHIDLNTSHNRCLTAQLLKPCEGLDRCSIYTRVVRIPDTCTEKTRTQSRAWPHLWNATRSKADDHNVCPPCHASEGFVEKNASYWVNHHIYTCAEDLLIGSSVWAVME